MVIMLYLYIGTEPYWDLVMLLNISAMNMHFEKIWDQGMVEGEDRYTDYDISHLNVSYFKSIRISNWTSTEKVCIILWLARIDV